MPARGLRYQIAFRSGLTRRRLSRITNARPFRPGVGSNQPVTRIAGAVSGSFCAASAAMAPVLSEAVNDVSFPLLKCSRAGTHGRIFT